jgi:hypothetical protein
MPTPRREAKSSNLKQHIALIRQMVERSMKDPETRMLAAKIVAGRFQERENKRTGDVSLVVRAWGTDFLAPEGEVCASRDDQCEIERIWDFIVLNLRYVYDPAVDDLFQTLKVSLITGSGDCDDYTVAFAALLKSIGFYVMARVIATKDEPNVWAHIYPMVGLPKDRPTHWVCLDATVEGFVPGSEYDKIGAYEDFEL